MKIQLLRPIVLFKLIDSATKCQHRLSANSGHTDEKCYFRHQVTKQLSRQECVPNPATCDNRIPRLNQSFFYYFSGSKFCSSTYGVPLLTTANTLDKSLLRTLFSTIIFSLTSFRFSYNNVSIHYRIELLYRPPC